RRVGKELSGVPDRALVDPRPPGRSGRRCRGDRRLPYGRTFGSRVDRGFEGEQGKQREASEAGRGAKGHPGSEGVQRGGGSKAARDSTDPATGGSSAWPRITRAGEAPVASSPGSQPADAGRERDRGPRGGDASATTSPRPVSACLPRRPGY